MNDVQSVYLPTWFRYRTATWNPAIAGYCRARLAGFDAVHIFGLYDLLGPAAARECRAQKIPYVVEPIGMFVPIVRNIFLKRVYHAQWGKEMLGGAAAVIATAEQEVEELAAGGIPRSKIVVATQRGGGAARIAGTRAISRQALRHCRRTCCVILFLGRLSQKKKPRSTAREFCTASRSKPFPRDKCGWRLPALMNPACRERLDRAGARELRSDLARGFHRPGIWRHEMGGLWRCRRVRAAVAE